MNIPAGLYKHYKGKNYKVLHTARHSETGELLVIYQAQYGDFDCWARPLSMFIETVTLPDGTEVPRFEPVILFETEPPHHGH